MPGGPSMRKADGTPHEEHDEEAPEQLQDSSQAVAAAPAEAAAEPEEKKGGFGGFGGMGGMSLSASKKEDDGPLDDPDDQVPVPLDCVEIGVYKTTNELDESIVEREFQQQEVSDYVTLGEIAGEMEDLRQEKEDFEEIAGSIRLELDALAKLTIKDQKEGKKQLNAARIWQIERRLKEDPTLSISDDEKGKYPFELPDNAAAKVKKNLARTYLKIRKSTWDLAPREARELDDRYALLKRL